MLLKSFIQALICFCEKQLESLIGFSRKILYLKKKLSNLENFVRIFFELLLKIKKVNLTKIVRIDKIYRVATLSGG